MTDRPEKNAQVDLEGPGVQLRRARKKRGLSVRDVAQELHLDEWMLQALEEDDFAALGAPVFAKGHMRKYGGMLGLDPDDLMIAYYRKRGRDDSPPPITQMMAPEPPSPRISWRPLGPILVVVAAIAAAFLVWSFYLRGDGSEPSSAGSAGGGLLPQSAAVPREAQQQEPQEPPAESPAVEQPVTVEEQQTEAGERGQFGLDTQTASAADVNAESPEPAPEDTVVAVPAGPETVEVRLSFSGESWVEVTDSDGERLIYTMVSAGRTRTVTGRPPIEVFLGLSRAVTLEVNGEYFAIPRGAIRGNTARFVIDPGSQ